MAQQDRAIATRQAILLAAGEVFSEMPFAQAKVSDVLDRLSVGKGALYFHFKNKHDLARAVLLEGRELLLSEAGKDRSRIEPARERLLALNTALVSLLAQSPLVAAFVRLSTQSRHEFPGDAIDFAEDWELAVREILTEASSRGELRDPSSVDELAWLIVSSVIGSKELLTPQDRPGRLADRIDRSLRALTGLAFS